MEQLKQAIRTKGIVLGTNVLRVDAFLNHQIDPQLMDAMGREFAHRFADDSVTRILTIEASGIAPAIFAGLHMNVPVVFAKKNIPITMDHDIYDADIFSFTKQKTYRIAVEKTYLTAHDRVLIIDDFLAAGQALTGLIKMVEQAQATVVGAGIVIEKGFQHGGDELRAKGIRIESLAIIDAMDAQGIVFRNELEGN